ncbi:MFS transporter [Rhodococcus sp. LB1]|uniref:MFS transporter n=1 Tax=Rhodococcus sp. LB1 TaxID=1807499 RepID=UPI00077AF66A|nr:MFS transporter [Rhodococcus sp. LB1]KXX55914.1 hypothetical protein AZG88_02480 [Rhodococcus sp. LB1]
MQTDVDLREQMRATPMDRRRWAIVFLCTIIAAIDGYENSVMAFVAPTLAQVWSLDTATIGYVLSAGLLGAALGAIFLSPLADRIGRRPHIIICLVLGAVGMVLTGLATDVPTLLAARTFAGLWVGAIVPSLSCLVSEYAPDHRRGTVMGIYGIGLPAGGLIGGLATGWLIDTWDWHGPFVATGLLSALAAVVAYLMLPESVDYLIEARPGHALRTYQKIGRRFGLATGDRLPERRGRAAEFGALRTVFTGTLLRRTAFLWSGYVLLIAAFYFANSWTPTMIANATGNAADGRFAGVLIGLGGICGTLAFAALSRKVSPRLVTAGLLVIGLPVYVAFATTYATSFGLAVAVLVGLTTVGGTVAYYAITPHVYPAANRGAAVGMMMGVGRAFSIAVPVLMGYWFAAGGSPGRAFQLYGVVMLASGCLVYLLHRSFCGRTEDPELVIDEDLASARTDRTVQHAANVAELGDVSPAMKPHSDARTKTDLPIPPTRLDPTNSRLGDGAAHTRC